VKAPQNIGAAMAGGKGARVRDPHDFYPTPEGTTRALLPVLSRIGWPNSVWECACGKGHISKILAANGYFVKSTDLISRGYGQAGVNFLRQNTTLAASIITNPPFKHAVDFLVHAQTVLGVEHVAFLLPSGFWHAKERVPIFNLHRPSHIIPLTWRLDVTGEGAPTMNCMWVIWSSLAPPIEGFFPLVSSEAKPGRYDEA
jgi:hypothetical protein